MPQYLQDRSHCNRERILFICFKAKNILQVVWLVCSNWQCHVHLKKVTTSSASICITSVIYFRVKVMVRQGETHGVLFLLHRHFLNHWKNRNNCSVKIQVVPLFWMILSFPLPFTVSAFPLPHPSLPPPFLPWHTFSFPSPLCSSPVLYPFPNSLFKYFIHSFTWWFNAKSA